METNPETLPLADELNARALFAAKLAALAAEKPAAKNGPAKKRGTFLTRTFFGHKDNADAAQTQDIPAIAAEPSETVQAELEKPAEGSAAPAAELSVEPVAAAAVSSAEPAVNEPPPEAPMPAPRLGRPAASAPDSREPQVTSPDLQRQEPTMTPTDTTHPSSATGQAFAQLTLGFEITSMQLTPAFRLGSVQLKALSNVVSLHLAAARSSDQSLAAGVSFRIERVELDDTKLFRSILLKPLGESHAVATPQPKLEVEHVAISGEGKDAPISVAASEKASSPVQLTGTFAIAALEFTPAFEIDSLRLEPVSKTALLRVSPATGSGVQNLPPSFEIAEIQLGDDAQLRGARLVPGTAGPV